MIKYDSNYGMLDGEIEVVCLYPIFKKLCKSNQLHYQFLGNKLVVSQKVITVFNETNHTKIPWDSQKIQLVVDCTGKNNKVSIYIFGGPCVFIQCALKLDLDFICLKQFGHVKVTLK